MWRNNRAKGLILGFVFVLFLSSAAWAQYYHVTGHVTDSRGAGVWQVDLDIFDSQTGLQFDIANDLTDQNGYYDILLFPGTFDIEYNAPPGMKLVSEIRRNIVVQSDVVVDVVLEDGFYLSGRVTDSHGDGVYQLDIDVDDVETGERILTPRDKTDANGDYQVVVPVGLFDVTYEPPRGSRLVAITIPNVRVNTDTVVNASLEDGFFLSGWVVDEGGSGLPDIDLDANDLSTGERIPTPRDNTDAAGHYEIVLPPGTFSIIFDPLARHDLAPFGLDTVALAGDTVLDTVVLLNGVWLSGRVTDAQGDPVEEADLDVIDSATQRSVLTIHDNTDSTGHYGAAVPPGVYDLVMNPPSGSGLGEGFFPSVSVLNDTTVDFVLGVAGIGGDPEGGGDRIPRSFGLSQNFPNPFNPQTTIRYLLPEVRPGETAPGRSGRRALLEVFDVRGRRVRMLVDRALPPGSYSVVWDGRDDGGNLVVSGVYLYRLRYGPYGQLKKMVVHK